MALAADYVMIMMLLGIDFEEAFTRLGGYAINDSSLLECFQISIDCDEIERARAKHLMEPLSGIGLG